MLKARKYFSYWLSTTYVCFQDGKWLQRTVWHLNFRKAVHSLFTAKVSTIAMRKILTSSLNRVLLLKLEVPRLVMKFPAFYRTQSFITAFTSARHLSLSWARSIQSIPTSPTSWSSILILSFYRSLGLPRGAIFLRFSPNSWIQLSSTYTCYMPRQFHFLLFEHLNNIWRAVQFITLITDGQLSESFIVISGVSQRSVLRLLPFLYGTEKRLLA
jgi:hypothetical protein